MNRTIRILVLLCSSVAAVHRVHAADPQETALTAQVAALPDSGAGGQIKAVLTVALERVKACQNVKDDNDARALLGDIRAALSIQPETLVAPASDTKTISLLRKPLVVEGNPYLQRLVDGAKVELAKPDSPWPKNTTEVNVFNGLGGETGSRSVGEEMEAWLWLYANPVSPLKGQPDVLARFLRLAHAYADAMDEHGKESDNAATKAGQGIFDDFAIAPAADALREFAQLYPGLLLASQKAQWDRGMTNGGRIMYGKAKDRPGEYANIDITLGYELVNFGLYLHNQSYLDKARFLEQVQKNNIYPDGAIAYIGHQNESCTYHDADLHYLARYYSITGDEQVLQMIKQTEWYGPVSDNKLCEFWTTPSWKDTYNSDRVFAGGEEAASVTGNPYLRGLCDAVLAERVDHRSWASNYSSLPWYRNDVKPLPLPDNYTVIDRNICGPRAWYGRFNYACTARAVPDTEAGLRTMMGVQMLSANGHLGQIAMDIYPRLRFKTNDLDDKGAFNRAAFASRLTDLKPAVVIGRSFSAVAASFVMQQYRSSSAGEKVDWQGRQLWFGLPDRVIGLVEVQPTKNGAKAMDVEGIVRLGTGGTVNGPATKIQPLGDNSWKYGELAVSILAHNYAQISTPEVPFRLPKYPNTEIRLVDSNRTGAPTALSAYKLDSHFYFLVEIRQASSDPGKAALVSAPSGEAAIELTVGQRHAFIAANLGDTDAACPVPAGSGGVNTSVHSSVSGVMQQPPVMLKPGELVVVLSSPHAQDKLPGWENFAAMMASRIGQP
jgi:hypothetical protein